MTNPHEDDPLTSRARRVGLKSVIRLFRGYRYVIGSALVLTTLGAVIALSQPWLTKLLIEAVSDASPFAHLIVILAALFVVGAVVEAGSQYLLDRVSENVARDLRRDIAHRVLGAPLALLSRFRAGDLLARATGDTTLVREMLSTGLVQLFSVAIYGVGTVVLMMTLDATLLLVMAVTIVLAAGLVILVLSGIRSATERAQGAIGVFAADLERVISSMRTVKAFSAETQERSRLDSSTDEAYRGGVRAARLGAIVSPAMELAVNGALLIVLLIGGVRVAQGNMAIGDLVAFLLYATYLVMPLAGLFGALAKLQHGLASLQRVKETDQLGREVPPAGVQTVTNPGQATSVCFHNVSATYDGNRNVVDGVSFEVTGPGLVAIVGPSGAGKTTVINLLEQFVSPTSGNVLLNGVDIAHLDAKAHRRLLTLVDQDSPLLDGTLRENLRYGRIAEDPTIGDEQLAQALEASGLGAFAAALPAGLDSPVGSRGHSISGGERQRVALARALLSPAPIYLFDEPSSSLDAKNEQLVASVIRKLASDYLVLVVTHRPRLVESADHTILIDSGKLIAQGRASEVPVIHDFLRASNSA